MEKGKWLFIGGYIPQHLEQKIYSSIKRNPPYAANSFQKALIKGFDSTLDRPLDIINEVYLGSFPSNCKIFFFKGDNFSHYPGSDDVNLSFINLTGVKQIIRPFGEKRAIRLWVKKNRNSPLYVFIYGCGRQYIRFIKYLKGHFKNVRVVLGILDLPEYVCLDNTNLLRGMLVKKLKRDFDKYKYYADFYMVVSPNIPNKINIDENKTVLVDCIIDSSKPFVPIKEQGLKKIVYTGTLSLHYGLLDFIEEFHKNPRKDVVLEIYGDGEAKEQIIEMSKRDSRIKYCGFVSQDSILEVQQSATILVNPRKPTDDFTNYSFPIKTAEYLLAGRPVVCYKLGSFSDDYSSVLQYFNEKESSSVNLVINRLLDMSIDELNKIGYAGYDYIIKNKNSKNQVEKIIKLVTKDLSY